MNFLRWVNAVFKEQEQKGSCFKYSHILTPPWNHEQRIRANLYRGAAAAFISLSPEIVLVVTQGQTQVHGCWHHHGCETQAGVL